MKVGDVVKERCSGQIGLVVGRYRHAEPDGNPDGDFMIHYHYRVLFGSEAVMVRNTRSLEMINESR